MQPSAARLASHSVARDYLRRLTFRPYLAGKGSVFRLLMWAAARTDRRGCTIIGYALIERGIDGQTRTLFRGEDFVEGYTADQLDFCRCDAEALSSEVDFRFPVKA